jgi:hypothetical protein
MDRISTVATKGIVDKDIGATENMKEMPMNLINELLYECFHEF